MTTATRRLRLSWTLWRRSRRIRKAARQLVKARLRQSLLHQMLQEQQQLVARLTQELPPAPANLRVEPQAQPLQPPREQPRPPAPAERPHPLSERGPMLTPGRPEPTPLPAELQIAQELGLSLSPTSSPSSGS